MTYLQSIKDVPKLKCRCYKIALVRGIAIVELFNGTAAPPCMLLRASRPA